MERRGAPRERLTWTLQAKVKAFLPARVIDISSTGVLLELDHPLPPRTACGIKIACDTDGVHLPAVIRRCCVGGHGTNEKGQKIILYHAGLAFENPDPALITRLGEFLALPEASPVDPGESAGPDDRREAPREVLPEGTLDITLDVESDDVS